MQPPSMALLRTFSPRWQALAHPSSPLARGCLAPPQPTLLPHTPHASFSSTPARAARKKQKNAKDPRISQIRYHLSHATVPRPLRFSRHRALRHWTIHRAWQLFESKQRQSHEAALERQYNSMYAACEALRLTDGDGLTAAEREQLGVPESETAAKDTGRLYRIAMLKDGIWGGVPIEYARIQTDTPPREGWNHAWKR